jgi:hypothetical protein
MTPEARALRLHIYQRTIEDGHPPRITELARHFEIPERKISDTLQTLETERALLVAPGGTRIEAVPPFSALPTPHWVETPRGGWWGHTAWQALAVPVVVESDAIIYSRSGGGQDPIVVAVQRGKALATPEPIVHVGVPAARWWDDIRYTCASILFFRDRWEIDGWCARSGFDPGETMSLGQCWTLAQEWYAGRLEPDWRRLSRDEAQASLDGAGLRGPFWDLMAPGPASR